MVFLVNWRLEATWKYKLFFRNSMSTIESRIVYSGHALDVLFHKCSCREVWLRA